MRVITLSAAMLLLVTSCSFDRDVTSVQEESILPRPATSAGRALLPLSSNTLSDISKLSIDGFERIHGEVGRGVASAVYEGSEASAGGSTLSVVVTAKRCAICRAMDLTEWRADRDELIDRLPREHRDDPALVFDVDPLHIPGATGIATYERSAPPGAEPTNALTLYYNNGINQVVLFVSPVTAGVDATREGMQEAARKVFAAVLPRL